MKFEAVQGSRRGAWVALVSVIGLLVGASETEGGSSDQGAAEAMAAFEESGRLHHPWESHLADVKQLSFGGENAEAYWSPDGKELIFQSTRPPYDCDQIFRMAADGSGETTLISTGTGRTTCGYFDHTGEGVLFASTHVEDKACPPTPDRSQGYVWPIYPSYEIYSSLPDGSQLVPLTANDVYDAEATVCPVDGSILFTSMRDGDLELYRMDADGSDVARLTETPGYDGGAFFSRDCTQIVWRASRPQPGKELEDYQGLLARGLVRPSKLELWVANGDGSEARQITYLDSGTFAPFFTPSGKRILFSSNYGTGSPREFEIWAIDVDGSRLERITYAPGFDGFPMFSPDGKWLAFGSNRNQGKPGETDVYVARWVEHEPKIEARAADRWAADVAWLADDERQGRGVHTAGLDASAAWLAEQFETLGVSPAAGEGGFLHSFQVPVEVEVGATTRLVVGGEVVPASDARPASFSSSGDQVEGAVVAAGYGISAAELGIDDYADLEVEGKIVAVRRFTPTSESFEESETQRRYSDLRYKAFNARQHGAAGLIVVDLPEVEEGQDLPEEAPLPSLQVNTKGEAGIPVFHLSRAHGSRIFEAPSGSLRVLLETDLTVRKTTSSNVVGKIPAGAKNRLEGAVLVGAHYDHLGFGGHGSLAPESQEPHNGADDNASGTASLLEIARHLVPRREELRRDVYLVAFSGEETGLLGSTALTRKPPEDVELEGLLAMVNLDMVGRLRGNSVAVLGGDSAAEWPELVEPICQSHKLRCGLDGDGYGPSDQTPFYAGGTPVLHFFTGAHQEYHKPSDDTHLLNAAGGARISAVVAELLAELAGREEALTYREVPSPAPQGDSRSYGAYLGTIPDYVGGEDGRSGVLLAGVREGSPADKAGFERGDWLVALGGTEVVDIHDFVYILRQSKPDQEATAVVLRGEERVPLKVIFGSRSTLRK